MKVDVEGTEDAVFEGGQIFIETFRPDILCEVLPEADGDRLDKLLAPAGMRRYLVTNAPARRNTADRARSRVP